MSDSSRSPKAVKARSLIQEFNDEKLKADNLIKEVLCSMEKCSSEIKEIIGTGPEPKDLNKKDM